ncbi:TnsD family Tn7-like transposition protein [Lysinibacillus sp. NPDC095746]|uniref:TnsD family Tn7-like transposition protein n=1 Tax=Lysinibacillus sp. NPDC095746 TaxID=3364134 RepID=UPI00381B6D25
MLSFFTDPYPNELLYSAISRYHFYIGNVGFAETLEELFGNRAVTPSIDFGSNLSTFVKKVGNNYSVEKILTENTIYPFFAPFITEEKQKMVFEDVSGNSGGLKGRLGISSTKVVKKDGVFYCSRCSKEDIEMFGEPYIHREHQLPGIDYCPHHELLLRVYPVNYTEHSRTGYIRLDKRMMDLGNSNDDTPKEFKKVQITLAKMAYKLLELPNNKITLVNVFNKYRTLLRENNWITRNSAVRQEDLLVAFNSKFPKGFLEKYNSDMKISNENNWLAIVVTNPNRQGVHPFRHLLLMYFFNQDIESFLMLKEDEGPFGSGPWPCLNVAANHYKKFVITEVKVSKREKTDIIIGKFKCSCGFEYTRLGPEKTESEKWRKNRVNAYGEEWEAKFDELVNMNMHREEIAAALGISESTVRSKISIKNKSEQRTEEYRSNLLLWRKEFPNANRKQFQREFIKIFTYLYKNDRKWLDENLPSKRSDMLQDMGQKIEGYRSLILKEKKNDPKVTRSKLWYKYNRACKCLYEHDFDWYSVNFPATIKNRRNTSHVDWDARDEEYYQKIIEIYPNLLSLEKPVRILRGLFSKRLNLFYLSIMDQMDKLPKTNKLLEEITETVQEFQIRRCCIVIDKMLEETGVVRFEELRETCAVGTPYFKGIKPYLEEYILKKQNDKGI